MSRTTVDIDDPVLRELKKLQKREGKSLGRLISDLLAAALSEKTRPAAPRPFRWPTREMGMPRIDLSDKDALMAILDADAPAPSGKP